MQSRRADTFPQFLAPPLPAGGPWRAPSSPEASVFSSADEIRLFVRTASRDVCTGFSTWPGRGQRSRSGNEGHYSLPNTQAHSCHDGPGSVTPNSSEDRQYLSPSRPGGRRPRRQRAVWEETNLIPSLSILHLRKLKLREVSDLLHPPGPGGESNPGPVAPGPELVLTAL